MVVENAQQVDQQPVVVGLGEVHLHLAALAGSLDSGSEIVELDRSTLQIDGAVVVALATTHALGCHSRLVTRVSDDSIGRYALDLLDESGINTDYVETASAVSTGVVFAATDPSSASSHLYRTRAQRSFSPEQPDALLADADAVVIDGTFPEPQLTLAENARSRGIPVVFDGTDSFDELRRLVGVADIVIASERVAVDLTDRAEISDSLVALSAMGPKAVVVTLGAAGSVGRHRDRTVEQPAFPVDVVDPSGAGPVFLGAFTTALVGGLPFASCMEFAGAAAALSCKALGPWAGIPSRRDIATLIRSCRGAKNKSK